MGGFLYNEENRKNASKDELNFIFSQAEKQLKESSDTANSVVSRSTIILTITVGLIISLTGYGIQKYSTLNSIDAIGATIIASNIYLFVILFYIRFNIKGHDYYTIGSRPNVLLHDWFPYTYPHEEERFNAIIISELESYQRRIEKNKKINTERWKAFKVSLNMLIGLPIFFILVYLILKFLF